MSKMSGKVCTDLSAGCWINYTDICLSMFHMYIMYLDSDLRIWTIRLYVYIYMCVCVFSNVLTIQAGLFIMIFNICSTPKMPLGLGFRGQKPPKCGEMQRERGLGPYQREQAHDASWSFMIARFLRFELLDSAFPDSLTPLNTPSHVHLQTLPLWL